jgi:hypothetical protein
MVLVRSQSYLTQVIGTPDSVDGRANFLDSGDCQAEKDRNDSDHNN